MATVNDAINEMINAGTVNTGKVSGLSRQIIAQANALFGNVLVNFESLGDRIVVSTSTSMNPFLQSGARESLRQVLKEKPNLKIKINSAYRTVAQQHILYQLYIRGTGLIPLAAKPGLSNHEDGLALDIDNYRDWKPSLENHGWNWQGEPDPVHFSYDIGNDEVGQLGVKAFQSLWNKYNPEDRVSVDGGFGDQTAARMNKSPANGFTMVGLFKKGDRSPTIQKIAQALVNAGFNIPISDTFDAVMETAVKEFQQKRGLAADGVVGSKTLRELDVR
jgi:hypothetical protein